MTAPVPLAIHHLDERIVVVEKPSGIHVHRTALSPDRDVLLTRVRDRIGRRVYPVHRLDRATSGLVVFALDPRSAEEVQRGWAGESVRKEYVALVRGTPPETFTSDRPLTRREDGVRQEAHTEFGTHTTDREFSLVTARLHTGRRHQIRRHLAHEGHQIVGDTSYGKGRINRWLREEFALPRLLLHAATLAFPDPDTGDPLSFTTPPPADFLAFLERFSPPLARGLCEICDGPPHEDSGAEEVRDERVGDPEDPRDPTGS